MKTAILIVAISALCGLWASADQAADAAAQVIALERQAMDGWLRGDPDPQLAITDPQITYFHAVTDTRLEGVQALRELYEQYRGTPLFERYEMLSPKVQVCGDVAVLTYRLARYTGTGTTYFNGTQVYQRKKAGWRVIHTHWSAAKLQQP